MRISQLYVGNLINIIINVIIIFLLNPSLPISSVCLSSQSFIASISHISLYRFTCCHSKLSFHFLAGFLYLCLISFLAFLCYLTYVNSFFLNIAFLCDSQAGLLNIYDQGAGVVFLKYFIWITWYLKQLNNKELGFIFGFVFFNIYPVL